MTPEFKRLQMPQASPFSQVDDKIRNVGSWQSAPKARGQLHGLGPRDKGCLGQLSDPAGRNVSEGWAGLERDNAGADPPAIWGRPRERGSNRHEHPLDPPGWWARHVGKVLRGIGGDPG